MEQEAPRELVSSSPCRSAAQRESIETHGPSEPIDPIDPIVPDDVPGPNYYIRLEKAYLGETDSAGGRRTCSSPWFIQGDQETSKIHRLLCIHESYP